MSSRQSNNDTTEEYIVPIFYFNQYNVGDHIATRRFIKVQYFVEEFKEF